MTTGKATALARPYALAAFEYALAQSDLAGWEAMLQNAAAIANDKRVVKLLKNPLVAEKQLLEFFTAILGQTLNTTEKKNFIHLLAEKNRLSVLPDILALFISYRADYEKTMAVQLVSAVPLDKAYEQKIAHALQQRLKRKISLESVIDKSLLGGALIRAGDVVIDGSVRGKLNRLVEFI